MKADIANSRLLVSRWHSWGR